MRGLVIGFGAAAESVCRQLLRRGEAVTVVDDRPTDESRARAARLGLDIALTPDGDDLDRLVAEFDLLLPSPGVPIGHPAIVAASRLGVPVWSEFELAARWDDRPVVAVTGTNGKTTVTELLRLMIERSGRSAVTAGNNDVPLVDALDTDADVLVVEASSFRLQFTDSFHPAVAVWLNISDDHLDWHPDFDHYAAAKERIFQLQRPGDTAVANAEDPVVLAAARRAPSAVTTFGLESGDYRVSQGAIVLPSGEPLVAVDELPRRLPHDLANALASVAAAVAAGVPAEDCAAVLGDFEGLPHRVQLIGESGGVRWFDDSKATTTASVLAAASAFDSIVLIAGGRAKGADLSPLRELAPKIRGVVAIGEAAPDIAAVFDGLDVAVAGSMDEAVSSAARLASPGDVVLLSPACASYDWYRNYAERGDDFARAVRELLDRTSA